MGHKILDGKTAVSEGYKVVSYRGIELPENMFNAVKSPFLKTLRYGNDLFKLIDHDAYFGAYSQFIDLLVKRPETIINIAMSWDSELQDWVILGWAMIEKDVLHYAWVKKEARRQGIGRSLVPKTITSFSHITNYGLSIWAKPANHPIIFNPFC